MGIGGAFGAFAGAGAAAAFSFLTLEAGFLGMVVALVYVWGEVGARLGSGMAVRWARCFCLGSSAHGRRGGAKRRRTLCQRAGAARDPSPAREGGSGCPFEAGWPRPKLAGIHRFRLVGNLFLGKAECNWGGWPRAHGSDALGTVAVELSSIAEPR